MKKIAFYTLGCRANQYQTFCLESQMTDDKYQIVDFSQSADTYVINTCIVTHDAERKSRQAIRRALRQNPKAKVVVTGCYAKIEKLSIAELFPQITIQDLSSFTYRPSSIVPRIRANLMVQDGCEHFCSYCIVPYARGKFKSKPLNDAIKEATELVKAGAREIILTGINLGAYQHNLSEVIKSLSAIDGLYRIRLSSIEPMYLTHGLIDTMASTPKVCHYLHIPLQSGDDRILTLMRRNYTTKDYLELINYIRTKMPNCGISTDIIVGFPGESEREYLNSVKFIEQVKFSRLHVFPYSKRKGTSAASFPNQVNEKEKQQRSRQLLLLGNKLMREFARQYLGKEVEILVERQGEGLTENYIRCFFEDPDDSTGKLIKIIGIKD